MPKDTSTATKGEKGKLLDRPPSRNTTTASTSLQQLKSNIESLPGIIKNAEDGLQHLVKKQWILPEQTVTCAHLATILLTLVATQSPRTSTDKISDNTANVIKSVAFLLEEVTITQYAEKIANRLASQPAPITHSETDHETTKLVKESLEDLKKTLQNQAETAQKNSKKLQALQDSLANIPLQTATNVKFSYREALMNGTTSRPPALTPPTNIHEAKLQNRLNIEACQTLIEIQSQTENPLHDAAPTDNNSTGKLKIAINRWLANSEIEDPPPPNSTSVGSPNAETRNCSLKPIPARLPYGSRPTQHGPYNHSWAIRSRSWIDSIR